MDPRLYREDLLRVTVAHATESYKEMVRVTSVIEDKAQKTAALAGVFLAAGFGFIKQENLRPDSPLGGFGTLFLLAVAIAILIVTVALCLSVLWVREQAAPIEMKVFVQIVEDVLRRPDSDLTEELQDHSRFEFVTLWRDILERQEKINGRKVKFLRIAQGLLTLAIFIVAISLLLVLASNLVTRVIAYAVGMFAR